MTKNSSKITLETIRSRAAPKSFQRGQQYYHSGAISHTIRRENTIEAHCQGSEYSPYRVSATLSERGIDYTSCTCQYDFGGDCKHVIALLLTYLHQPEKFEERAPLNDALQARSKEDLILLIQQMVNRYPDLQAMVERPTPGSQKQVRGKIDTEPFRRELHQAINEWEGYYGDSSAVDVLASLVGSAQQFQTQEDWRSAAAIYCTLLAECVDNSDFFQDEDSGSLINEMVHALSLCLERPEIVEDNIQRREILDHLLSVYITDTEIGGIGLGDEAPEIIMTYGTPDDLVEIQKRVQEMQAKSSKSEYRKWAAEIYGYFLNDLEAVTHSDPEVGLKRLREQELYYVLVEKLLMLHRTEEAIAVVKEELSNPYDRLRGVVTLQRAGQTEIAIQLAEETLKQDAGSNLLYHLQDWLLYQYKETGRQEAYLDLLYQRITQSPSVQFYPTLQEAAQALGRWEEIRAKLIGWLESNKHHEVLVRIYLYDKEWDKAWQTIEIMQRSEPSTQGQYQFRGHLLDLEVAQATLSTHPQKALPVLSQYVYRYINQRNRTSYAEAAQLLVKMRVLYKQLNDEAGWTKLIAQLRDEFRRLPALQDELRRAGL